VNRAREALGEKNIGDAEAEIALALERLQAVAADAGANAKAALAPIRDTLVKLRREARTVKPRVQEQLRKVARRIDELSRRWDEPERREGSR
jgi:ElaB/YqjD/DUF883 family membrane-anchored ribosome-binding protein